MPDLVTALLAIVWLLYIVAGAWITTRMNAQVNRIQGEKSPLQAYRALREEFEAGDVTLKSYGRRLTALELEDEELKTRIVKIQNKLNAEERHDRDQADKLALQRLADEIQSTEDVPQNSQPPTVGRTMDGDLIDFR